MGAIFLLSSIPGDELPLPGIRFGDKAAHFLAYAFLGFLIGIRRVLRVPGFPARAVAGPPVSPTPPADLPGLAVGILYGLSDEVHQLYVPLRQFSFADLAADALGVAAGIGMCRYLESRRSRRLS